MSFINKCNKDIFRLKTKIRKLVISILTLQNYERKLFQAEGNDTSENSDILEVMNHFRNGKHIDISK